jgi:hypothetical protein
MTDKETERNGNSFVSLYLFLILYLYLGSTCCTDAARVLPVDCQEASRGCQEAYFVPIPQRCQVTGSATQVTGQERFGLPSNFAVEWVMDITGIVEAIDAEILRLQQAKALLTSDAAPLKRSSPPARKRTIGRRRQGTDRRSVESKMGQD